METETPPSPEAPWKPHPYQLHRFHDADLLAASAAKRYADCAERAVQRHGRFTVVLAGGNTPRLLYQKLTEEPYRESLPWSKTVFLFGDERCVSPDEENSNYRMACDTLFDPLEIAPHQVFRMKGEQTAVEAARRYAVRLGDLFVGQDHKRFDLLLLGVGDDGHTASLFPETEALEETERWVVGNQVPRLDEWRITMTLKALNAAQRVMFLVTGEAKAQVVAEAFGGLPHEAKHPCELVAPHGARRDVLLDESAASQLPGK